MKICSFTLSLLLVPLLLVVPPVALSAKLNYSDISNDSFTTEPTKDIPENLDDLFIFPTMSSIKFDSTRWKNSVASRPFMLFDLYHLPLNEYPIEKVYEMLGAPDEMKHATAISPDETATYDLGFLNGSRAMVVVRMQKGQVVWLSLERMATTFDTRTRNLWQHVNLTWATVAQELNRELFIVGVPVRFLPETILCSKKTTVDTNSRQRTGNVEIESRDDGLTVKQFRIYYLKSDGSEASTPWESTNERKKITQDLRLLCRKSEISNLRSRHRPYLDFGLPFSSDKWKSFGTKFPGFRATMISSLIRTYPLIGMSRAEVHQLLGEAVVSKNNDVFSASSKDDSSNQVPLPATVNAASIESYEIESYAMSSPGCGMGGSQAFEIEYKGDFVVAYRCHYFSGLGRSNRSSGALFGFPSANADIPSH